MDDCEHDLKELQDFLLTTADQVSGLKTEAHSLEIVANYYSLAQQFQTIFAHFNFSVKNEDDHF